MSEPLKRYAVFCETSFTYVNAINPEEAKKEALKEFAEFGYTEDDLPKFEVEEPKL